MLDVRLVPDLPEDAFAFVSLCGGLGEGGKCLSPGLGADGSLRFVELVAIVEDVEDSDVASGAAFGQGIVAGSLEVVLAFLPLDAAPAKVHPDELEAAIADQIEILGLATEMNVGPEAVGHSQLRQRDCADRGEGKKAQEEKCCGKLFDPWLAEFENGPGGVLCSWIAHLVHP